MGGVIIILTRGMSKWLTYGIPARYRVILMERLGGLFFDGGCSCVRDFFRWSFGSVPLRVSRGEYAFFAWERDSIHTTCLCTYISLV